MLPIFSDTNLAFNRIQFFHFKIDIEIDPETPQLVIFNRQSKTILTQNLEYMQIDGKQKDIEISNIIFSLNQSLTTM